MSGPLQAALDICDRRLEAGSRAPVAVAFSGGGDSTALLLVACAFAARTGRPLLAIHVDHGLQPQSGAWAARAEATAAGLGVPCVTLRWEGPRPAAGVPAAARAARHRLVAEAARGAGARVVLVGHTLDDQLENALMRAEGEPIGPLREWSPSPVWPEGRGLFHCRPLLGLRRAELRDWLRGQGRGWIDDPANEDLRHPRVRARKAAGQGARREFAADPELGAWAGAWAATPWGGFEIDRGALAAAPPEAALRLLQIAAACAAGVEALPRPGRASALLQRLLGAGAFTATLGGARIEAAEAVVVSREPGEAARGGLSPLRLGAGQPMVWDGRFEFIARREGLEVRPLRGRMARLSAADRAFLRTIPAPVRPSLPVMGTMEGTDESLRLVLGATGAHIDCVDAQVRLLCEERFRGAAGLVTKEVELGTNARMANVPPPSYVDAEGKD